MMYSNMNERNRFSNNRKFKAILNSVIYKSINPYLNKFNTHWLFFGRSRKSLQSENMS